MSLIIIKIFKDIDLTCPPRLAIAILYDEIPHNFCQRFSLEDGVGIVKTD